MISKRVAFITAWAVAILLGVTYIGKKSAKALLESETAQTKVKSERLKAQLPPQPPGATDADFEGVRIGASDAQIVATLGNRVKKQSKPTKWPYAYSDRWIERHDFHGVPLDVFFVMGDDSKSLHQIVLREQARDEPRDTLVAHFQQLEAALTDEYGAPAKEGSAMRQERMWMVGTTEILLSHLQHQTGAATGDEMLTVRYRKSD
jgi:hypothetical protein